MRLTASLLEDFPVCAFKSKLRYFDRVQMPLTQEDVSGLYLGRVAHAGIDRYLATNDLMEVGPAVCLSVEQELRGRLDDEQRGKLARKACSLVKRWGEFHRPDRFRTTRIKLTHAAARLSGCRLDGTVSGVNSRIVLPLAPPIGVFDEFVIQPDRVCEDGVGPSLYDWKFVNKLESDDAEVEALRFDLQSAIYQYGLRQLGLCVFRVAHVRVLREDPTPFKVNKDGTVSKRRIRNSAEAYVAACESAGQVPDPAFAATLMPFCKEPVIYRGMHEVQSIWEQVVVPRALEISRAMEHGFTRRMTRYACARCAYREPCWEGAMGRGEGAFASTVPLPIVGHDASVQGYELA